MVNTGYIAFLQETPSGFDENGNPIAAAKSFSANVPCNLEVITREYKLLVHGQYMQARYSIVIDNFRIAAIDLSSLKEIRLQDSKMNELGVFQVQNKEFLNITNRLKITV